MKFSPFVTMRSPTVQRPLRGWLVRNDSLVVRFLCSPIGRPVSRALDLWLMSARVEQDYTTYCRITRGQP